MYIARGGNNCNVECCTGYPFLLNTPPPSTTRPSSTTTPAPLPGKNYINISNNCFLKFVWSLKNKGYIGCFADSFPRDMANLLVDGSAGMNIEYCRALCSSKNYTFAGLQAG